VGASEATRLLLLILLLGSFRGTSLALIATTVLSPAALPLALNESTFCFEQWLGGLIDGAGCFLLSKKGAPSLETTVGLSEQPCLEHVKQVFGGTIEHGVRVCVTAFTAVGGVFTILRQVNRVGARWGLPLTYTPAH
jgi:hypothetical protein